MKALTCTQCGATIEDVAANSVIIHCNYCGARILLDPISKAPPGLVDVGELYNEEPAVTPTVKIVALVCVAAFVIPLLIGAFFLKGQKEYSVVNSPRPLAGPTSYPTPSPWNVSTEPARPAPVVNYQPRVSWDGPNDMEFFAEPEVDVSSVAELSSDEVKKTVFKNRIVKLKVVINTEGEIDKVETISGHPILVEAAAASAKRSIFRSRSKPTTRVLTYTFRVLED